MHETVDEYAERMRVERDAARKQAVGYHQWLSAIAEALSGTALRTVDDLAPDVAKLKAERDALRTTVEAFGKTEHWLTWVQLEAWKSALSVAERERDEAKETLAEGGLVWKRVTTLEAERDDLREAARINLVRAEQAERARDAALAARDSARQEIEDFRSGVATSEMFARMRAERDAALDDNHSLQEQVDDLRAERSALKAERDAALALAEERGERNTRLLKAERDAALTRAGDANIALAACEAEWHDASDKLITALARAEAAEANVVFVTRQLSDTDTYRASAERVVGAVERNAGAYAMSTELEEELERHRAEYSKGES